MDNNYDNYGNYGYQPNNNNYENDAYQMAESPYTQYGDPNGFNYENMIDNQHGDFEEEQNDDTVDYESHSESFFDTPEIASLPRVLMMGPTRAGKTSIQMVLFENAAPYQTYRSTETVLIKKRLVAKSSPLCKFTLWEIPGDWYDPRSNGGGGSPFSGSPNVDGGIAAGGEYLYQGRQQQDQFQQSRMMSRQQPVHANDFDCFQNNTYRVNDDSGQTMPQQEQPSEQDLQDKDIFGNANALIFVFDAQQEPYNDTMQYFTETMRRAARVNPTLAIEVFINKVDGDLFQTEDDKYKCKREITDQITEELSFADDIPESIEVTYHLTSVYDYSIYSAFSKVVQRLIPQLSTLEGLLDALVRNCWMEKAYLFDMSNKLYICRDTRSLENNQLEELCSGLIECVLDVNGIYGVTGGNEEVDNSDGQDDIDSSSEPPTSEQKSERDGSLNEGDVNQGLGGLGDEVGNDMNDDGNDVLLGKLIGEGEEKDPNSDIFDSKSECVIRMAKGVVSRSNHITHITNRIMCVHRRCFLFFYLLVALVRKGS
jgi:hypothetical protein